jgi:DnaJ-class molecular chaperone
MTICVGWHERCWVARGPRYFNGRNHAPRKLGQPALKDPYEILGVARTAPDEEIRKVYRRLARKHHPDVNPGDKEAEARFKEISAAYDLLSDAEKRRRFDAGEIDASGAERPQQKYYRDFATGEGADRYANGSGFADFANTDELFAELLGRRRQSRGMDLHAQLAVDLIDAITGASRQLPMPDGSAISLTIPPGIEDGQILRLKGKGAAAPGNSPPGDLLVRISIRPHRFFQREGEDVRIELPVTLKEAVLGAKVRTPTPFGAVMLTVPKGSSSGTVLRLKGKGVARPGAPGDLLVTLKIVLPKETDAELEAFLGKWSPKDEEDVRKEYAP